MHKGQETRLCMQFIYYIGTATTIYRIAGNFRGRKLLQIVWVCGYAQKFKFLGLIRPHLTVLDYFPGASQQLCFSAN